MDRVCMPSIRLCVHRPIGLDSATTAWNTKHVPEARRTKPDRAPCPICRPRFCVLRPSGSLCCHPAPLPHLSTPILGFAALGVALLATLALTAKPAAADATLVVEADTGKVLHA